MGSYAPGHFDVKKVAIIGAGPCGISAAKYLRAQGAVESIVIFEQQDEVGGVWNFDETTPGPYPFPQMDPFYPPDPPVQVHPDKAPIFPSAMYKKLHANISGALMEFRGQKFPSGTWAFPKREDIQEYVVTYAEDVRELIRFCFQVKTVSRRPEDGRDKWYIEAQSTVGGEWIRDTFDAVVVANGHYSTPAIPAIKNIEKFREAFPTLMSHSKQFRTPDPFKDKRVVIVGNGPSGMDIALQINAVCKQPALLSVRQPTPAERLAHTGCEEIAEIAEFLPEQRGIRLVDGRTVTDVDAVVFCTGFLFSYPFLSGLQHKLITDGRGVHGLYKHLFDIKHPTLVFPGLNMKAVPWPISESQAAMFAVVWANHLELPPVEEMERWSQELRERQGSRLQVLGPLEDAMYINECHDWVMKASHLGKEPPHWDKELFWQRRIYNEAKLLFEQQGCKATTLGELGLHYDPENESAAAKGP